MRKLIAKCLGVQVGDFRVRKYEAAIYGLIIGLVIGWVAGRLI